MAKRKIKLNDPTSEEFDPLAGVPETKKVVLRETEFARRAAVLRDTEAELRRLQERRTPKVDWRDDDDVRVYHADRREELRRKEVETLTKGTFRCQGKCERIIGVLSQWVVVSGTKKSRKSKEKAMCRSCFAMERQAGQVVKLSGTVFKAEVRYRVDGSALAEARVLAGLSRAEFASLAGWHRSYQQKLESGNVLSVTSEVSHTIAAVLAKRNVCIEDQLID